MYNVYISMVPDNNLYQKLSIKIFFVTFCVACVASGPPPHTHTHTQHERARRTFSTSDLQTEISNISHQKSESTQPRGSLGGSAGV